jgi:hypothetical protein
MFVGLFVFITKMTCKGLKMILEGKKRSVKKTLTISRNIK